MWIFLIPLVVAEAVFWLAVAFVGWRALKAFQSQSWPQMGLWLALFAAPFVFYFYQLLAADVREAQRNDYVAKFEKVSLPSNHPKQLDLHGHITDNEMFLLLDLLNLDQLAKFEKKPRKGKLYGRLVGLKPQCRGTSGEMFAIWQRKRRFNGTTKHVKSCLTSKWTKMSADRSHIPAIEFRLGPRTTLSEKGLVQWASGSFEVRLRERDSNKLIDYWERPFVSRPAEPGPWGYAFPANTKSKKYRAPNRLEFVLKATKIL